MTEDKLLESLKEDMLNTLQQLDFENLQVQQTLLNKQLNVLDGLRDVYAYKQEMGLYITNNELSELRSSTKTQEKSAVLIEDKSASSEPDLEVAKETVNVNMNSQADRPVYTFERKLRGGVIEDIQAFVPEGIIRRLQLVHGDKVYATPKETSDPNKNYFLYEIAEKGPGEDSQERVQYNYCPVVKEAGRFAVEYSAETGESIRFNEALYSIILDEKDVFDFSISEGDLIDIAHPTDKPDKAKVLWKHSVDVIDSIETLEKPTTQTKVKKNLKKEDAEHEQTLDDKTVLVIGNEPKKNCYKHVIESRGGKFIWADAKFSLVRLRPLVKKADVVCFLLGVSGHTGMEHIKRMCKDYDVPFETTWSKGQTSIIRIAEEAEVSA